MAKDIKADMKRNIVQITDNIYWAGINDRKSNLFEGLWPLDKGMAYNSYLVIDDNVTLIDTVDSGFVDPFFEKIKYILGKDRKIDTLIINHMEPDHSGAIGRLVSEYPDIELIGSKLATKMLDGMYGIKENVKSIKDGDELNTGKHSFRFHVTPWLHWPETIMTYEESEKILFSGDAFGTFGALDGGIFDDEVVYEQFESEYRRYYSNIVGKYTGYTQKALNKLQGLEVNKIAPTHGPVWRTNPGKIIEDYHKWSTYTTEKGVVIAYASMYGNTTQVVDLTARLLSEAGIENIKIYNTSKTHISHIVSEIWNYKGVILASPTYNMDLHPTVEALVHEIKHLGIKDHILGIISNSLWNNAVTKILSKFSEDIGWEMVAPPAEVKGTMKDEDFSAFKELADSMSNKLNHLYENGSAAMKH